MVLQPRPQGRLRRRGRRHRQHAAFEAEGGRGQAERAASGSVRAEDHGAEAGHQAGRRRPPLKPSVTDSPAPAAKDNLVAGSAPIVPPNSFDSRFGAVR